MAHLQLIAANGAVGNGNYGYGYWWWGGWWWIWAIIVFFFLIIIFAAAGNYTGYYPRRTRRTMPLGSPASGEPYPPDYPQSRAWGWDGWALAWLWIFIIFIICLAFFGGGHWWWGY